MFPAWFKTLSEGKSVAAKVIATFNRCCYLQLESAEGNTLLCLGHPSIQAGPINFLVSGRQWQLLQARLHVGAVAEIGAGRFVLAGISVDLATVETWQPTALAALCQVPGELVRQRLDDVRQHARPGSLLEVIAAMDSLAVTRKKEQEPAGLGSAMQEYIAPLIVALQHELSTCINVGDAVGARRRCFLRAPELIGAGPGLTPAGDDLLAGVLLTLRFFALGASADNLYTELQSQMPERTHLISAALLAEAGAGRATQPLASFFQALGDASDAFDALALARQIDTLGHSSGWDLVAGVVLATQAVTHSFPVMAGQTPWPTTTRQSIHA